MSLLIVLGLLAGPPLLLLSLLGPPISGWPTGEQLRAWVQQPLTERTLTAALTIAAWLVWLVLAYTVAVRILPASALPRAGWRACHCRRPCRQPPAGWPELPFSVLARTP